MGTVLITNLYFQKYTGSELHTLEIAKRFSQLGYEVIVATFSKTFPLLEYVDGFQVIDITKEKLEKVDFDIVFIQHFPVFDYLATHYSITYKHMIVSILSSFNAFETLPACYKNADLISVVSEECAETITPYERNVFVFKNSADKTFFQKFKTNHKCELKSIAVISNHVPDEVKELPDFLPEIKFSFLGCGDNQELVTADLLAEYDLVITIGRTVQQCFACGTPVYVYDYFGGPGYINENNIRTAEKHNFSGRGFEKKSAQCIVDDVIKKYTENLEHLQYLHDYASEYFCFEKTFDQMLCQVVNEKKQKQKILNCYDALYERRIKAYSEIFPLTPFLNDVSAGRTQLYYITDSEGLDERNSISWQYADGYVIDRTFRLSSNKLFRFDPSDKPCKCRIIEADVDGNPVKSFCEAVNAIYRKEEFDYFLTNDSQIVFHQTVNEYVRIKYQVFNLRNDEIIQLSESLQTQLKERDNSFIRRIFKKNLGK